VTPEQLENVRKHVTEQFPPGSPAAGDYLSDRLATIETARRRFPYVFPVHILDSPDPEQIGILIGCAIMACPILIWETVIWMFPSRPDMERFQRLISKTTGPFV
jgi:hypothetical protein